MSETAVAGALPVAEEDVNQRRDLNALVFVAGAGLLTVVGALLAVYIDARGAFRVWPPKGVYPYNYSAVMVTMTLLLGSVTVEWAARSARDETRGVLGGLFMTTAFGIAVVNALAFAFNNFDFGVSSHLYGTIVYALLIVMIIAVAVATLLAFLVGLRSMNEQLGDAYSARIRATALFWHVVVLSWCAVYTVVYLVK